MDKSAVGHDYVAKVEKHASQTDAAKGFGGKFGVQSDRVDKVTRNTHPHFVRICYIFPRYNYTCILNYRVLSVGTIRRSW